MIRSLAREQLRSQRRFVAWAAAVMALAVGVASYGALMAVELDQAADATNHALALDTENAAWVAVQAEGSEWGDVPLTDFSDSIDAALADGVRTGVAVTLLTMDAGAPADGLHFRWPVAVWGDVDWDAIVTEGSPPSAGEVALSEAYARDIGLGLGDKVSFYVPSSDLPLPVTATVSGLTRSPVETAGLWLPLLNHVWIAPDDIQAYADAALEARGEGSPGVILDARVTWSGNSPDISAITDPQDAQTWEAFSGENSSQHWVWLATGVLVVGSIAMAFAFGRAQAQSRTHWVATARALGATRRHVVLATLAEAGVLAAVGATVGYALGTIGATIHLAVVHAQVPGAGIATVAGFSPVVALIAIALGLVLGLVIAGVPAFWAARVNPAAALKPENDITTAEVGRRVRFWPVTLVWASVGVGAFAAGIAGTTDDLLAYGLILLFMALSPVVANEALRWLVPLVGRWLSRRPEKVALVAGDSLVARPRQFTVPALLFALGVGSILAFAAPEIIRVASEGWAPGDMSFDSLLEVAWPDWLAAGSLLVLGALAALATVIAIATATVTASESATREALGVSVRQTRGAAGLAQGVTLLLGVVVGIAVATLVTLVQLPTVPVAVPEIGRNWELALTSLLQVHLFVVGVALALAILSSVVVALAARASTSTSTPHRSSAKV